MLERITTWRPTDLSGLELRLGVEVREPYPRHWHEEVQLCLATAGGGLLDYRGEVSPTPVGSLFIVHPGEVHANAAVGDAGCSFRSMYLPAETFGRRLPFFPRPVIVDREVVRLFLELHRTLEEAGERLRAGSLLLDLADKLVERHAERPAAAAAVGRERDAVRRAREHLHASYAENVSLDELAAVAGLSPYHLHRVFREEVGMPPHAYQTQLRILRAKALIRDGHTLADVAAATGFTDQSHLSRHFRWLVKLTPGRYLAGSKNVQDRGRAS